MRSQGAKKAAILLSLALGPSCVMAWLGLRSIGIEEREARQTAVTRAQHAAIQVDHFLSEQITRLQRRFQEELSRRPRSRTIASATKRVYRLCQRTEGYGLAFALDLDGALIVPGAIPYSRQAPPTRSEYEIFRAARDLARASENEVGDLSFAQSILLGALGDVSNRQLHAFIELELAQMAIRHKLPQMALDHFQNLYLKYPDVRAPNQQPLALTYWPEFADLLQQAERPVLPPLAPLATLAENLATDRWRLPGAVRDTRWQLVMGHLKALTDSLQEDDPEQAARVKQETLRLKSLRRSFDVMQSRAAPEIGRRLEEMVDKNLIEEEFDSTPFDVEISTIDGSHLYLAVPYPQEGSVALLAVELDLEALAGSLTIRLPDISTPYEARLALFEKDRLLAGDQKLLASKSTEMGLPSLTSLHGWRVLAEPLDPDAPAREARQRWFYYGILVFSCFFMALVGSVVTVKSIDRQVMLARMRTKLVRNVSHELRTPVASIRMLGEILQGGGLPRERELEYFDRIAGEAIRLHTLVEKVLSLAQIEEGARQLQLQAELFGSLVEHFVEDFKHSEEGRDIEMTCQDLSQGALSQIDREAFKQVLVNLLSNAVKYGEGQKIDIEVFADAGAVSVAVRDYGRGIGLEARKKLFSPFFREKVEDNSATGIGIGLAIARQLVTLMKGRIVIDSTAKTKGTRFVVTFPRLPQGSEN
jgi:signal transduction histidine kinase